MSSQEEDLEDGEIASDEEGVAEPGPREEAREQEREHEHEHELEEAKEEKSVKKSEPISSSLKAPKGGKPKELQKLKKDFEKKKENRRDPKKIRESNDRDGKRRKRRASQEEVKNRKEKRRKVEGSKSVDKNEEDDIDEDEMLGVCIRGGSPTVNLEKTEVWSGKQPILDPHWQFSENSENDSEFDDRDDRKRRRREKERRNFKSSSREDREIKKRIQMKRKGKNRKDVDNSEMICINFMKGNCNKGNDCFYSHSVCPPKKMELCKFYLMDCCAKRDKCLYLHDEFPCKFFHTGLKCYSGKKCKFSHDPLNSLSKDILLKHLETAPKEILGDFPRLSRDCAETMVNNKTTGKPMDTSKIPSLFDIQVSIPPEFQSSVNEKGEERTTPPCSPPPNVKTSPKTKPKEGTKYYQESESNDDEQGQECTSPIDFAKELEAYRNKQLQNKSSYSGQEKSEGPVSPSKSESKSDGEEKPHRRHRKLQDEEENGKPEEKEGKRRKRKYEEKRKERLKVDEEDEEESTGRKDKKYKKERRARKESRSSDRDSDREDKMENLPVRLSDDGSFGGIKFKIINKKEIRKSSTNSESEVLMPSKIEKPNEFLSSDDEMPLNYLLKSEKADKSSDKLKEDMEEFGVEIKDDVEDETDENENENALIIETNDDQEEEEKSEAVVPKHLPKKQQELFLRIQAQQNQKVKDEPEKKKKSDTEQKEYGSGSENDAEFGRTPSPEPADENWYSSDDEDASKKESPLKSVLKSLNSDKKQTGLPVINPSTADSGRSLTPPPKPKIEITALNDLTKINITELLSSIRQVTNKSTASESSVLKPPVVPPAASYEPPKIENPIKVNYFEPEKKEIKDPRLRDPRIIPEMKAASGRRNSSDITSKPTGKSIYDSANFNIDSQDSDFRHQSKFDSDERIKNLESIVPFGDIDLRTLGRHGEGQSENDFDLRKFGLPFKPVPVHSAATEIDASLNSHPPINYKVETILIPRPDFSSIKISPNDPQVKKDPRLRRLFRINSSETDPKEELKKSGAPTDPRQRKPPIADTPKSPTESPFSPKQNEGNVLGNNQNLLGANLLMLAQLGLSAAAGFDPRVQQLLNKTPQEIEMLRNQLSSLENQPDFDLFRKQIMTNDNMDMIRAPNPGLLPTPMPAPGMGLLGPAPGFMMPGMGMSDPSVMMGPMGPMPPQNPMGFDPRFNQNEEEMNDNDNGNRHFNRGFRGGDRRGRGSWRGNRDRNWDRDSRRHAKRDDRDRNRHTRVRDDRRERKRSNTPD